MMIKNASALLAVFSTVATFSIVACSGSSGTTSDTKSTSSSSGASGTSSSGSSGTSSSGTASSSGTSSSGGSTSGGASSSGSSGSSSGANDAGTVSTGVDAGVDAANFVCGKPGDQGNSIGVGKYCDNFGDCLGNSGAMLCAVIGDPNAHFCTAICSSPTDTTTCGENASCQCQSGQCGCFPDACK